MAAEIYFRNNLVQFEQLQDERFVNFSVPILLYG
jgi:hypothetical protein